MNLRARRNVLCLLFKRLVILICHCIFVFPVFAGNTVQVETANIAAQINDKLASLQRNPNQPNLESEVLSLTKSLFQLNNIHYSKDSYEENGMTHEILKIYADSSSLFNKLAMTKGKQFGISLYFAPLPIGRVQAKYDFDSKSILFAWDLDKVIGLESPLFFHELVHAILSNAIFQSGKDFVVGSILVKKKISQFNMNDMMNPYVQFLSLQELTTYPYQHYLQWIKAKRVGTLEALFEAHTNITGNATGELIWSEELKKASRVLLSELDSEEVSIVVDDKYTNDAKGIQLRVSNETYEMYLMFGNSSLLPQEYKEAIRNRLQEIRKYAEEFVTLAEEIEGAPLSDSKAEIESFEAKLKKWNQLSNTRLMASKRSEVCGRLSQMQAVHEPR